MAILIISVACIGQNVPTTQANTTSTYTWQDNPWQKGNWQFDFRRYIGFESRDYEFGDVDAGSGNMFDLNFGTKYFVADHIAVGLNVMYESEKYKSVLDAVEKTSNYMIWPSATYMTGLSDNISLYGEVAVGFGGLKNSYEYGSIDEDESYSRFGYKISGGLPIRVARNSPLYFTPEFHYRGISTDYDDGKEKDNQFGLNMMFETYLPCSAKGWDTNGRWSNGRYRQGHSILGYTTRAGIMFGSTTFEYDDDYEDEEQDFFRAKFGGEYLYYIVNNVALGAEVRINSQKWENSDVDYEVTRTKLSFRPVVEFNMPGRARNLFIRGAFGFGSEKYKETYLGDEDEETVKFNSWGAHLGYNMFVAERIALTPMIGYESESEEFENVDDKQKGSGLSIGVGLRYNFGRGL